MELPERAGELGLRPAPGGAREGAGALPGRRRRPPTSTWCSADPDVDAVAHRHADQHAPPHRQGGARGRQARLRREADDRRHGAGLRAGRAGRAPAASRSWSATPSSSARRCARSRSSSTSGELGDIYFVTTQRVNLGLHQKDVSVVWDLAPHDLSILYYWLGEAADDRQRHRPRLHRARASPTWPSSTCASPAASSPRSRSSWLSPVKLRRTIVVGSKKMLVYDDTENVEKVKVFDHGVRLQGARGLRRVPAQLPHRRHRRAQDRRHRAAVRSRRSTSCTASRSGEPPLTDGWAGPARGRLARGRAGVARRRRRRDAARRRRSCA